ncbi:toprim domain-containing protein [Reinekea blandensis]|uniref:DnaG primase-like protein n=1 Tax=Reinekea blandensis MED297 TaxID=314283 RepID=A4B8W4_9GAMM|nr:toprim domain-containing protein [Reinekea blandensis]EAR11065.1 DnaG primase-like protein [Reinekea sp. MED297] [Reinekea blandensis MED297]
MDLYVEKQGAISIARNLSHDVDDSVFVVPDSISSQERRLTDQVLQHYQKTLKTHVRARRFMCHRGLDDQKLVDQFRIGYADRTLGLSLQKLSKEDEASSRGALQRVGLLKPSGHEFFRGALVVPFINGEGIVTGAYGRRITKKLKTHSVYFVHWRTPETRFFNEAAIQKQSEVFLCKNPLDALSLWSLGLTNTIALMGVFSFSMGHLTFLHKSGVKNVIIAFGDSREESVCARRIAQLNNRIGINTYIMLLPDGLDVNACLSSMRNPKRLLMQALSNPFVMSNAHPDRH